MFVVATLLAVLLCLYGSAKAQAGDNVSSTDNRDVHAIKNYENNLISNSYQRGRLYVRPEEMGVKHCKLVRI